MSTLAQNLRLIRQRLMQPDSDNPSDAILLNILLEKIADHTLQLNNTRSHWSVASTTITTSSGTEEYSIPAADFGRPFLVYTADSSDTYHVRREIPFSLIQDARYRYQGSQQTGQQTHTAEVVEFYRTPATGPAWMARITPIPGATSTYEIWYEAVYDVASLDDSPGLSPFHHLIRCETALDALPMCAWGGIAIDQKTALWELRCKSLAAVLAPAIEKYQKQFNDYKAQSTRERVHQKLGVGRDYLDEWGEGSYGSMVSGWGL